MVAAATDGSKGGLMGAALHAISQQLNPNRKAARQAIKFSLERVLALSQRIRITEDFLPVVNAWNQLVYDAWSLGPSPNGYSKLAIRLLPPFSLSMLKTPYALDCYYAAVDSIVAKVKFVPVSCVSPVGAESVIDNVELLLGIARVLDLHVPRPSGYSHIHRVHQALQKEVPVILASARLLREGNRFETRAVLDNGSQ